MLELDFAALSDPAKDQYFLTNPSKLQVILDAADIRETDNVIEIGAGVGTVARVLPRCASLTLIELDQRLIPALQVNAPEYASVLNTDGFAVLRRPELHFDVILGNLPGAATNDLASLLTAIDFRVSVVAAGSVDPFELLNDQLDYSVLCTVQGSDFTPSQPGVSYLVRVRQRQETRSATSDYH